MRWPKAEKDQSEDGIIVGECCPVFDDVRTENSILAMKSPFSDDAAPISSSN
jgi:hypothetical protein